MTGASSSSRGVIISKERPTEARSPLGPFTEFENINRQAGIGAPTVAGQQTWIAKLPAPGGPTFLWLCDGIE